MRKTRLPFKQLFKHFSESEKEIEAEKKRKDLLIVTKDVYDFKEKVNNGEFITTRTLKN